MRTILKSLNICTKALESSIHIYIKLFTKNKL